MGGAGNSTETHITIHRPLDYASLACHGELQYSTTFTHVNTNTHTHEHTAQTGYSGGGHGGGLSWVVVSCHDAEMFLDLSDISEGGKRGIWSASPL